MRSFTKNLLIFIIVSAFLWADAEGVRPRRSKKSVPRLKRTKKPGPRIVNGDEVEPHSLPYMAAIHTTIDNKPVLCGGSLIASTLVMTAARCVSGASEAEIILGAHDLDKKESSQVQLISSEFIIHHEYKNDSNLHDIALIQLPSIVTLNENINIVPLLTLENLTDNYNDKLGTVAGWGKISDTDPKYSNVLLSVNVTIIPTLMCELSYLFSLTFDQMCTSGVEKKNICFGDSGSPLVVDGYQVGIASYGSDFGCEVGMPGAYTRMTSYLSWLYISIDTYAEKLKNV